MPFARDLLYESLTAATAAHMGGGNALMGALKHADMRISYAIAQRERETNTKYKQFLKEKKIRVIA